MDLRDVVYIIEGSLEVSRLLVDGPDGEPIYEAVLYDNTHDPCQLQNKQPEPESNWRYGQARAQGWYTERAALEELVRLMAGDVLGHDWPVMWKSCTEWTRIPPTLVVGDPAVNVPQPQPSPLETAPPAA